MLYNFKDTKEYGMEHRRYTKENIKNIAEGVLKIYSDQSYPVKVLEIANNLDLQVFESTFDRDDVSGMLKASEKHILIAQSGNPKRQRFSIAHEIGHYVLHYKGKVFNKDETEKHVSFRDNASSLGFSVKEIEANFFASNLLMPEKKIREMYHDFTLKEMAHFLNVSEIAMRHRLEFLGLLNE